MSLEPRRMPVTATNVLFEAIIARDQQALRDALATAAPELLDSRDSSGNTPLHCAAKACWATGVEALVQHGASVLARTPAGDTPLLWGTYKGLDVPAVQALINAGADVNVLGDCGNRPLHMAASADHAEVVNVLLAAGAAIDVANDFGNTPWQLSKSRPVKDMLARAAAPEGRSELQTQLRLHLEQLLAARAAEQQQQLAEQQHVEARRLAAERRRQDEDERQDQMEEAARAAAAAAAEAAARAEQERRQAEEAARKAEEEAAKEAARAAKLKAKAAAAKKK